ncbi:MAG: HDOD domain-containing protein [Planctomycetales bacterium]|nr:HDOD domain-containing protein [Planctomycetales bacterium]
MTEGVLHKVEDKRRLGKKIAERLRKSPEVRPFPAVITQVLAACNDPNANSKKFESIIECDPALAGKTLRFANSPLFCPTVEVKSIAQAVSLLGLRKLRSLAMSVAGASMFSSGDRAKNQRQRLWNHSVGCAVVARNVAGYVPGVDPDPAFLAGIFHDVGKLLFYDEIPDEYAAIDDAFSGTRLIEEEQFVLGTTHEIVGHTSAECWDLPDEIQSAIGWHHCPDVVKSCQKFTQAINIADRLAHHWGIGSDAKPEEHQLDQIAHGLGVTTSQLESIETESRRSFDETMAVAR